jgi:hypothetical protein
MTESKTGWQRDVDVETKANNLYHFVETCGSSTVLSCSNM